MPAHKMIKFHEPWLSPSRNSTSSRSMISAGAGASGNDFHYLANVQAGLRLITGLRCRIFIRNEDDQKFFSWMRTLQRQFAWRLLTINDAAKSSRAWTTAPITSRTTTSTYGALKRRPCRNRVNQVSQWPVAEAVCS
jgi:hypothetical protein